MSISFKIDGALIPYQTVRLTGSMNAGGVTGLPSVAFGGEIGMAGIIIEDPTGTLDIVGWHKFTVEESLCSKVRIWTGWIGSRRVGRGPYRNAAGRIWDCLLVDQNALFGFRAFRASSAKRSAETDIARVDFALTSAPLSGLFTITAFADVTNNPGLFGEANYVEQFPLNLFESVAGSSAKNFYAFWDHSIGATTIYYNTFDATDRTSTLKISNVLTDYDGTTTFSPEIDAEMDRDPSRQYSGVLFRWRGGLEYSQDPFGDARPERDLVYSTDRVGKLATAQALVASMVAQHADERDELACMVRLPASKVNLILEGERVEVKFSHLPGFETFRFVKVIERNVIPTPGQDAIYDVHLKLATRGPVGFPGGGDPGDLPHQPPPEGAHYWEGAGSVENDIGPQFVAGPKQFVAGTYNYQITIVEAPKPDNTYATDVGLSLAGGTSFTGFSIDNTPSPGGDSTVYTGSFSISGGGAVSNISYNSSPPPNVGTIAAATDFDFIASTAGPHTPKPHKFTDISFWFDLVGSGSDPIPPDVGQPVNDEVPTRTSDTTPVTYTTAWPYADGSLRVFVDNIDQTAAVVETDPETGEFTLAFLPAAGEKVRVYYQGR